MSAETVEEGKGCNFCACRKAQKSAQLIEINALRHLYKALHDREGTEQWCRGKPIVPLYYDMSMINSKSFVWSKMGFKLGGAAS
jgi:hypothetical protein